MRSINEHKQLLEVGYGGRTTDSIPTKELNAISKSINAKLPNKIIKGKRATTKYFELMSDLKDAGHIEVDTSSDIHVANGNTRDDIIYDTGEYFIELTRRIGNELRDNALTVAVRKK